jgi:hypothetical protein
VTIRRTFAKKQCGFVLRLTYLWSQSDLLKWLPPCARTILPGDSAMKFIGLVLLAALIAVLGVGGVLYAGRNERTGIPVPVLLLAPFDGASTTNELPRETAE